MNAIGAVPRIPPVPDLCSDPMANLARRIRAIDYLDTFDKQALLDLVQAADQAATMEQRRHDVLVDSVAYGGRWLRRMRPAR